MTEPLWTTGEIAAAIGGHRIGADLPVQGLTFDSRSVEPGDLFIALAGARDGHDFIPAARNQGAVAALVSRPTEGPGVLVDDTLRALEALGVAARERAPAARRGAVTGSVGKTSVTQAVRLGLSLAGPAHSSVKSFNNHIGVPLTLARMPRDTERAVFEIGMNHAGEITPLVQMVRPQAVVITTVGPVHVENFPDGEAGGAAAKAEIFDGLAPGGLAILNADNVWFDELSARARAQGAVVASFGQGPGCDAQLLDFQAQGGAARIKARLRGESLDFPILQTGLHWGLNSMAVLLMLEALEVSRDLALTALGAFEPMVGRGAEQQLSVRGGRFTLIDESYNANPVSMAAAIATLGARKVEGRRVVVLTDMLELGPAGPDFHRALAEPLARAQVDLVFCAGPLMKSLFDALPSTRRGGYAESAAQIGAQVVQAVEPGDVVMVKGSNGSKAGAVADALAAFGRAQGDQG
ncbi:MAG TPA: UDP-N-acetylmuramoyl-tripeptide--D-alanyl-D-alanine ligase [Phenylobacterium sp.]|nr:UDP-N-acetylmuramoyl-tripeptide--D-alanyl-D-alanine ligase [Phenylobacterium sp.]